MKQTTRGWINGFVGVAIFAGSLPATKVAVLELDPVFVTAVRAAVAGILAAAILVLSRQKLPARIDLMSLLLTTLGVVLGFPLLTALALERMTAAHSIVYLGVLPLCTAIFAVLRGGESHKPVFWLFALLGAAFVSGYAALTSTGSSCLGDILMLAAVLFCGMGYAEGAQLSRRLGGWQVISWALVLALPVAMLMTWVSRPSEWVQVSSSAWIALAYVSIFSMLVGFIFWYRGLAQGGIAAVGQLQLLQPFMGLGLAALFLHETVSV